MIKHVARVFALGAVIGFFLAMPAMAAEKAVSVSASIVDVQRILQESMAAKSVQQKLEETRSSYQTEIAAEEDVLRTEESNLAKARETLASDAYAEKEQQLRQRFMVVEKKVQARRKALDQAFTDSMNRVREALQDVVGGLARERGISLVLVKQQVLWSDKGLDLTDEVLARLNKALPDVQVVIAPDNQAGDKDVVVRPKKSTDAVKKSALKK